MLQNATPLRKSAPGPPSSSDEHVSCTASAAENASLQILFKFPNACHRFWKCYKTLTFCSLLTRCTIRAPATRNDIWTSNIWTSNAKRHLNVQKWSEHVVLFTFWLRNMLRATTASTFSTSHLPKVFWTHQFFTLLTSKCASRRNGVHFFDSSTSKSGPDLVCFVHFDFEMCFAPQPRANFHLSSAQRAPHPPL